MDRKSAEAKAVDDPLYSFTVEIGKFSDVPWLAGHVELLPPLYPSLPLSPLKVSGRGAIEMRVGFLWLIYAPSCKGSILPVTEHSTDSTG